MLRMNVASVGAAVSERRVARTLRRKDVSATNDWEVWTAG